MGESMLKSKFFKFVSCLIPVKSWRKKLRQFGKISISRPKINADKGNEIIITNKADLKKLSISIKGKGNKIYIDSKDIEIISSLSIWIDGSNNEIKILSNCKIDKMTFMIHADNCRFHIGKDCFAGGVTINADPTASGRFLSVGDGSIMSTGVYLALGDEHPVYDLATNKLINDGPDKNIELSERVWICRNVIVLKDTKISHDSIIAAASVVKGHFSENNVILAGNLAKIVKRGIYWKKTLI